MLRSVINFFTEPAPLGRAQGPDISRWNFKARGFDPSTARERIDFVFQKVTEGISWTDPRIEEHWQGVKQVPIRFAYHYQRAGLSWELQVLRFLDTASRYSFHGLVIDVEKINNMESATRFITGDTFFQDTRRMIEYIWKLTNYRVILYTNKDVYQNFLVPAMLRTYGPEGQHFLEDPRLGFWYAQYFYAWSVNKDPVLPTNRAAGWDFWQITESARGSDWGVDSGNVDVNVFDGTPGQLAAWVGVDADPPAPPPPVVVPDPETEEETWTGTVITPTRMIVRSMPRVAPETDTTLRLNRDDRVSGRLWVGNGYVWMKLANPHPNKWVAVRAHPDGDKFIRLDLQSPAPPPVVVPAEGMAMVVWDDQNPDWGYKSRTLSLEHMDDTYNPPAVNRFYPQGIDKMGEFYVNLAEPYDWKAAIIAVNGGDVQKWEYLTKGNPGTATYNKGWPGQSYLVFSGNKLNGELVGDWYRFETLKPSDLPKVRGMTIQSHPHLVHRFTCVTWDPWRRVTKRIQSTGTPRGQVYQFVVSKEGIAYIPKRHVVFV